MNLSAAIGAISGFNECVTFWQWVKSTISSLHSRWSGSQEQDLQGRVLQLESGLQRLRDTLPAMHNLINKEEWRSHDGTVASLLPNLNKDAVFDAEDLLDEFGWYEMRVQVEGNASQSNFTEFFDTVIQGNFNKLSDVQSRLNHLSSQLNNMGLPEVSEHFNKLRPETTSFPNEKKLFGRDKKLEQVLGFLNVPTSSKRKRATSSASTSASNQVNLPVLVITGIGGVGKTTLAQHICSHQRVKSHFELIVWICVSDDFDVKRLTKEVIQSCTGKEAAIDNLDSLQRALSNHVKNKRLLIVLDDMWDDALKENGQCWKQFCTPFRSVREGSAMLVTTRCPRVAKGVGTMEPVILEGLKDDVFWNFFKLCAFGSEDSNNHPELEDIGRSILPKLKGSPLALKTLGRMLRMDLQASHWNSILESELWELKQEPTDILPALRLSYMYLPFYLKQCFAFCAVYPKDYKFKKEHLAEIWAAEGFVEPQDGVRIKDIGCQYFEDLAARSFFQKVNGGYVIHDLLHDMAQKVSEHDCFILRNKSDFDKVPRNVRHLYVLPSSDFDNSNLLGLCNYTKLRTLICKKSLGNKTGLVMDSWCTKLQRMRVISCPFTNELPDKFDKWKHLRYLEISRACPLKTIPSSLCSLYNLQILYAKKCKLESLPSDFGKLISLQKFESEGFPYYAGCHMTLHSADGQGQGIRLINNMNQFRGHLQIDNVGTLSKDHAAETKLKNKKYLDELTLKITPYYTPSYNTFRVNEIEVLEVLEVLQPPISLKSLFLSNYAGVSLPSWFQPQNLPSLKSLTFSCCLGLESISSPMISHSINSNEMPAIGIFMSLTDLTIYECGNISNLEHFLHPDYVPAIKKIRIEWCKMLTSLPTDKFGDFHFLEELYVAYCAIIRLQRLVSPSLKKLILASLPYLQELTINRQSLTSIGGSTAAFPSLNVLRIENCHKLPTLDDLLTQENLPAIEAIHIQSCPELLSLPGERFGSFPYLKHLVVSNCPSLNWQRRLVLPSYLQSLSLRSCGDILPFFPFCLQNLTSLVSLQISGCNGIKSIPGNIWRNNLVSLEELKIWDCPDLVSIGGARAVAKIKNVDIHGCPKIKRGRTR